MNIEENNFQNEENKHENKPNKGKHFVRKIPTNIILIIIVIVLFALLVTGSTSVFKTQTKTTKFGLADVGELVTQTCYLTEMQDSKEHREFFNLFEIPFTESRQIFSYDIEVDAAVDFEKISIKNIDNEKKEITINIPHSKIYKATLNLDSLKVYLDSESLFSRINLEKHNEALNAMKEQGIEDAKANGILDAADTNAKKLIEGFYKGNEQYKEYNINYEYIGG